MGSGTWQVPHAQDCEHKGQRPCPHGSYNLMGTGRVGEVQQTHFLVRKRAWGGGKDHRGATKSEVQDGKGS